jgi:hypothetical protein
MEKKIEEQIWYTGHGLHIWGECQTRRGLFPRHWPPIQESIHASRQDKDQNNKQDAVIT